MTEKIELILMLENCTKSKHKLKDIKDKHIKLLVESILNIKKSKEVIQELKK